MRRSVEIPTIRITRSLHTTRTLFGFGFLGRLEGGSSIVIDLIGDFDFVFSVNSFANHLFRYHDGRGGILEIQGIRRLRDVGSGTKGGHRGNGGGGKHTGRGLLDVRHKGWECRGRLGGWSTWRNVYHDISRSERGVSTRNQPTVEKRERDPIHRCVSGYILDNNLFWGKGGCQTRQPSVLPVLFGKTAFGCHNNSIHPCHTYEEPRPEPRGRQTPKGSPTTTSSSSWSIFPLGSSSQQ